MDREKKILRSLRKEIRPAVEPLTEEYFGKKFIKNNLEKYDVLWGFEGFEGKLEKRKGEKANLFLGDTWSNFRGTEIMAEGIRTILHELTHLYLWTEFKDQADQMDIVLKEGYCNLSPYEILGDSKKGRLEEAKNHVKDYDRKVSSCLEDEHVKKGLNDGSNYFEYFPFGSLEEVLSYDYLRKEKSLGKRNSLLFDKPKFERYVENYFNSNL